MLPMGAAVGVDCLRASFHAVKDGRCVYKARHRFVNLCALKEASQRDQR